MTTQEIRNFFTEKLTKSGTHRDDLRSQFPGTDQEWLTGLFAFANRRPNGILTK